MKKNEDRMDCKGPGATRTAWIVALYMFVFLSVGRSARGAEEDPRLQAQAAVDNGLKWLATHQMTEGPDAGSWRVPEQRYRTAVASFAGLAFLANEYLPGEGEYGKVVERAMNYVKPSMTSDGYLGQGASQGMYIHAICTLFGLSYLGLSPDPDTENELAVWCQKSLNIIAEAQKVSRESFARGGWRYTPSSSESDLSVTSWQLLVLHSARQCGYVIEDESIEEALRFINSSFVQQTNSPSGPRSGFLYRVGFKNEPELAATGAALFIKSILEQHVDERVKPALEYLAKYPPAWGGVDQYGGYFFFNAFYMTQGMFQIGDATWNDYITAMRQILSILILSLEKQYLPMYQRQNTLFR